LDPWWLWGSVSAGAVIIGFGVAADHVGWPTIIGDITVNLGTAVGLAGVLVAFQRRLERRTEAVREEVRDARKDIAAVRAEVEASSAEQPFRPRHELLAEYREKVAARPAAPFLAEEQLLADHQASFRDAEERRADLRRQFLAEHGLGEVNPLAEAFMANELKDELRGVLNAAGVYHLPELRFEQDPLDPSDPLRDWWKATGSVRTWDSWSGWFRSQRLAHVNVELHTRLEMAALYAATADEATGLRVFHLTCRAGAEMLAIALDARRAVDPPADNPSEKSTWLQFDGKSAADELEWRTRQLDVQVMPPIVLTVCEDLISAVRLSEPHSRMLWQSRDAEPNSWLEVQSRLHGAEGPGRKRLFHVLFRRRYAALLEPAVTAIDRLHLPGLELPRLDALDLSPAKAKATGSDSSSTS